MRTKTNLDIISGQMDVVPLLDVFFLLLIFFLTSSSLVFQQGIPVELPRAQASTIRAAEKMVITITQSDQPDQVLFFNDNPVKWSELERELREFVLDSRLLMTKRGRAQGRDREAASPMLVLRADAMVPYERIIEVMSLARSLNLGVYLVTESDKREAANHARRPGTPRRRME